MEIWKTLPVGIHTTREEYRKMLVSSNFGFSENAFDIMGKLRFPKEKQSVELFKSTIGELGFTIDPTYEEICNKLTQLHYKKCIIDVGPALRLEYCEQLKNDEVLIIMEPVYVISWNTPFIFALSSDDKKSYLSDYRAYPDDIISIDTSIVFCR